MFRTDNDIANDVARRVEMGKSLREDDSKRQYSGAVLNFTIEKEASVIDMIIESRKQEARQKFPHVDKEIHEEYWRNVARILTNKPFQLEACGEHATPSKTIEEIETRMVRAFRGEDLSPQGK